MEAKKKQDEEEGDSDEEIDMPRVRDSFALDYIPDYDPDNLDEDSSYMQGGLNKQALD